MTESFDVPELETLRLLNYGTEVDLVEAATTYIQAVMPEWVPRGGNAQPLTAGILTPTGWTTMGALKVGDEINAPDGGHSVVTGIFPKGELPTYRVTFDDGSTTLASDDHLWLMGQRHKKDKIYRTSELIDALGNDTVDRLRLPRIAQQEIADTFLPLDPWLAGFLVGDGGLTRDSVKFTCSEPELVDRVRDTLPEGCIVNHYGGIEYSIKGTTHVGRHSYNPVRVALEELGLMGKGAADKSIPDAYLYGSIKTRIAFLRGLMDADGHVATTGNAEISTVSEQLAKDVASLVRSLGGRAKTNHRADVFYTAPKQPVKTRGRAAYRIHVRLPYDVNPFSLPRKAERARLVTGNQRYRTLESVEYVGMVECQCISVSSPSHLYVTDDYIPTHNTEVVLLEALAVMLGPEILSVQLLGPRVTEQLVGMMGTVRSEGTEARGRAEFTVTNSAPVQVIPAGTRLRLSLDTTIETVDVFTTEELSIITSETLTGQVNVVADQIGSLPNGSPSGAPLSVVDNLPFIESAQLAEALLGGLDLEDDDVFAGRAAATLARQNSTLVHPPQFAYAALSTVGIGRALTLDNFDPAFPEATTYGHVTVAVAGLDGLAVSAPLMEDLRVDLAEQALASLTLHVIAPTYTPVDIAVTVRAVPGFTEAQVIDSVTAALTAWINPLTWDWNDAATQFEIVTVVGNAPGVREVTAAPATINLTGVAPLPTLGDIDVTVTA